MSVIAFDGKMIAADTMSNNGIIRTKTQKLFFFEKPGFNYYVFVCGDLANGLLMIDWFKKKFIVESDFQFPNIDRNSNHATMVVLSVDENNNKNVLEYSGTHIPIVIQEPIWAYGDGGELALGAMAAGANAKQAVEIACKYSITCGFPIDNCLTDYKEGITKKEVNYGLE